MSAADFKLAAESVHDQRGTEITCRNTRCWFEHASDQVFRSIDARSDLQNRIMMDAEMESRSLTEKLTAPVNKIVDRHREMLSEMLADSGALGKDENVRKVATFC